MARKWHSHVVGLPYWSHMRAISTVLGPDTGSMMRVLCDTAADGGGEFWSGVE